MFAIQKELKGQIVIIMEDNDGNGRIIISNEIYRKTDTYGNSFALKLKNAGWSNSIDKSIVASGNYRGYTKKVDWLKHEFNDYFFESSYFCDRDNNGKSKSAATVEKEILDMF